MATFTLSADGTLLIPGGFTVAEPPFSLRAPDGSGFTMPELDDLKKQVASLTEQNAALQLKITNAQKALA